MSLPGTALSRFANQGKHGFAHLDEWGTLQPCSVLASYVAGSLGTVVMKDIVIRNSDPSTADADGTRSIAIGGRSAVAVAGANSVAIGGDSIAGLGAEVTRASSVAVGHEAEVTGGSSVAIGDTATCSVNADGQVAIGQNAAASATGALAAGVDTVASGSGSVALGEGSHATAAGATAVGSDSRATIANATACGKSATATTGTTPSALGYNTVATSNQSTAVGAEAQAKTQQRATVFGYNSSAENDSALVLGTGTHATGSQSMMLGDGLTHAIANCFSVVVNSSWLFALPAATSNGNGMTVVSQATSLTTTVTCNETAFELIPYGMTGNTNNSTTPFPSSSRRAFNINNSYVNANTRVMITFTRIDTVQPHFTVTAKCAAGVINVVLVNGDTINFDACKLTIFLMFIVPA